MLAQKVNVYVNHPDLTHPALVYSQKVGADWKLIWRSASEIILALLHGNRHSDNLVVVEAPRGVIPEGMMIHRSPESPQGMDILELGNASLLDRNQDEIPSPSRYLKKSWSERTVITGMTIPSEGLLGSRRKTEIAKN